MKIKAFKVTAKDLKPGDLFSIMGEEYWENESALNHMGAVGQRVYIRTNSPCPIDEENEEIFKIKIIRKEEK